MKKYFKPNIAITNEHGSWVFLLSPLLIGLFAGGNWSIVSLYLILAALAGFLIRQPVTILVKVKSRRRSPRDLPAARFWTIAYSLLGGIMILGLVLRGYGFVLYLALPAIPVFAWHLYLVQKRAERGKMGVEIVASGILALAAPAAYWVGEGYPAPTGWWLWCLAWFQSAASIVYAFLRLEQRPLREVPTLPTRFRMGTRALTYTTFNFAAVETAIAATMSAMSAVDVENPEDMSEEEMSNEIDDAVSDAEDAYQQTTSATDEAASDGTLTQEELDEIEAYLSDLAYAIALAEELIYLYDDVYGELATETLYLLTELEDDLDELAAFANDMVELLITAEEALDEGLVGAEDLIAQFQEAASQVDTAALVEAKDTWVEARQAEAENRGAMLADMTPTEVAGSRRETLLSAFNYVDTAQAALADGKLSLSEVMNVGQLGVNVQASFGQFSGPLLQNRSPEIGNINALFAQGQLPQAMNGVNNLEGLLGKRP